MISAQSSRQEPRGILVFEEKKRTGNGWIFGLKKEK